MTDQQEPQGDQGENTSPVSGTVKIALFVVFAIIAVAFVVMTQGQGGN